MHKKAGASAKDFINMVFFTTQEWFSEELKKKGHNFQYNWEKYVNNNDWLKRVLNIDRI